MNSKEELRKLSKWLAKDGFTPSVGFMIFYTKHHLVECVKLLLDHNCIYNDQCLRFAEQHPEIHKLYQNHHMKTIEDPKHIMELFKTDNVKTIQILYPKLTVCLADILEHAGPKSLQFVLNEVNLKLKKFQVEEPQVPKSRFSS
jgi:hypothetical protein